MSSYKALLISLILIKTIFRSSTRPQILIEIISDQLQGLPTPPATSPDETNCHRTARRHVASGKKITLLQRASWHYHLIWSYNHRAEVTLPVQVRRKKRPTDVSNSNTFDQFQTTMTMTRLMMEMMMMFKQQTNQTSDVRRETWLSWPIALPRSGSPQLFIRSS